MLKVKIFTHADIDQLEGGINTFFQKNPDITVVSVTQTESGEFQKSWAVTLTILYREKV